MSRVASNLRYYNLTRRKVHAGKLVPLCRANGPIGRDVTCKTCIRIARQQAVGSKLNEWEAKRVKALLREFVRQKSAEWRARNPDKAREACRRWREQNRDMQRLANREWYARNRERKRLYNAAYYARRRARMTPIHRLRRGRG